MSAERAWALGMELKQAANTEHRKKFHLMRRLQRSVKHASELLQLCEACERCDARTRLEAQVQCDVYMHVYSVGHYCSNYHLSTGILLFCLHV